MSTTKISGWICGYCAKRYATQSEAEECLLNDQLQEQHKHD